ncbi:MAG: hypothetical protein VX646_01225 [Verrucomicrobiota bacterium]|nr:hypothetical protein [Verrucomicrobiota bacterium]
MEYKDLEDLNKEYGGIWSNDWSQSVPLKKSKTRRAAFGRIVDNPISNLLIDLFMVSKILYLRGRPDDELDNDPQLGFGSYVLLDMFDEQYWPDEKLEEIKLQIGGNLTAYFSHLMIYGDMEQIRSLKTRTATVIEKVTEYFNGKKNPDSSALSVVSFYKFTNQKLTRKILKYELEENHGHKLTEDQIYNLVKRLNIADKLDKD